MKLVKLYCSDSRFRTIRFNDGLNVVLGKVRRRNDTHKDSHNLGKSTLVELLDFMFLKKVDKDYFLRRYKPKSLYPYLCTTFMNLQPSCSTCNKKKSDEVPPPDEEIFQLFVKESTVKSDSPVEFRLDNAGVIKYLIDPNVKSLKIDFSCPGKPKLEKGYNHFFKISTLYQAHTDIAEELIWKSRIYNKVIIEDYKRLFTGLGFKNSDFQRFILGNYDQTEDILKRPMAKMTQDIARQLHLIEKPK